MSDTPSPPATAATTAWVSVADAADRAGIDTRTVRQWYRTGRIPTRRAEGVLGAFLVPLDAVLTLARQPRQEVEDAGAGPSGLDARYWSAETEVAREEATAARHELSAVQAELADATSELRASQDQLAFLRAQLAEASEDTRSFRQQVAGLETERERLAQENRRLRAGLAASLPVGPAPAASDDGARLVRAGDTGGRPVRSRKLTASDALSGLLASTQADDADPAPGPEAGADPGDADELASIADPDPVAARTGGADEPAAGFAGFGRSGDDLLPEREKKGLRGRRS